MLRIPLPLHPSIFDVYDAFECDEMTQSAHLLCYNQLVRLSYVISLGFHWILCGLRRYRRVLNAKGYTCYFVDKDTT